MAKPSKEQCYFKNGTWLDYSDTLFYFYSNCDDDPVILEIKEMKRLVDSLTAMKERAARMQQVIDKRPAAATDSLRYLYGKTIAASRLNTVVRLMMGRMGKSVVIFLQEFYMSNKTPTELRPGTIIDIDSNQCWYDLDKFARDACASNFDDYQ